MNPVQFGQVNITNAKVEKWEGHSATVMNVTLTDADKALSPIDEFAGDSFRLKIEHDRHNLLTIKGVLHSNGAYGGDAEVLLIKPEVISPLLSRIMEGVDSEDKNLLGEMRAITSLPNADNRAVESQYVGALNKIYTNANIKAVHNSMVLEFTDVIQNFQNWIENPNEPTAEPVIEEKKQSLWEFFKSSDLLGFFS